MSRFEEVKERVKEAIDLAGLIEGYLPLRASGRNMVALCPFHQEKTPSFTVFADGQYFKCFGCGKAGDIFTFVMEREGVAFREALEILAERAGVSLDGVFGRERRGPRLDVHGGLAIVQRLCTELLRGPQGARAREYLEGRGLLDAVDAFGLGVHPQQRGGLARLARAQAVPAEVLAQAGLVTEDGYEPFVGRLMFPIQDERGRVVGFGGRDLGDAPAKYRNSPESAFFHKSRVLYGLRQAKQAGARRIVVVEGYTDVLACHLSGFRGAVASLGTAFTKEHAQKLRRYATDGVVLLFDGDDAGRAAAARAFEELVSTELQIRIALLDQGIDPADLLAPRPGLSAQELAARKDRFAQILDAAEDALTVWFRLQRRGLDMSLENHVAGVVRECAQVLARVSDPVSRHVLRDRMAAHLGLDAESMRRSVGRLLPRSPSRTGSRSGQGPAASRVTAPGTGASGTSAPASSSTLSREAEAELEMLACVLQNPHLASALQQESFKAAPTERLRLAVCGAEKRNFGGAPALLEHLFTACAEDPATSRLLGRCAELSSHIKEPAETLRLLSERRRAHFERQAAGRTRRLLVAAREQGDRELAEQLTRRYLEQLRTSVVAPRAGVAPRTVVAPRAGAPGSLPGGDLKDASK